jgi:hypothetical protein
MINMIIGLVLHEDMRVRLRVRPCSVHVEDASLDDDLSRTSKAFTMSREPDIVVDSVRGPFYT